MREKRRKRKGTFCRGTVLALWCGMGNLARQNANGSNSRKSSWVHCTINSCHSPSLCVLVRNDGSVIATKYLHRLGIERSEISK